MKPEHELQGGLEGEVGSGVSKTAAVESTLMFVIFRQRHLIKRAAQKVQQPLPAPTAFLTPIPFLSLSLFISHSLFLSRPLALHVCPAALTYQSWRIGVLTA